MVFRWNYRILALRISNSVHQEAQVPQWGKANSLRHQGTEPQETHKVRYNCQHSVSPKQLTSNCLKISSSISQDNDLFRWKIPRRIVRNINSKVPRIITKIKRIKSHIKQWIENYLIAWFIWTSETIFNRFKQQKLRFHSKTRNEMKHFKNTKFFDNIRKYWIMNLSFVLFFF